MAAPLILETYPANEDTGIPISESLYVIFDRGIDLESVRKSIVLYGADFDTVSGPDSAQWIDENGTNPFFLRSPGFQGTVDCAFSTVYVDSLGVDIAGPPVVTGEADEVSGSYRMKVIITPKKPLAPSVSYTLYVIGVGGVTSRTVFDTVPDPGNTGLGECSVFGGYTGAAADSLVVEITTGGDVGTAKYRWYYSGSGVGTAIPGVLTSRRYRRLEDGVQIRFSGSGFVAGDLFEVGVEPATQLAASTRVVFTTNDGSFATAPDSPSTPATSLPPTSSAVAGSAVADSFLEVLTMVPPDAGTHIRFKDGIITLTFSDDLDDATITQETVRVWAYPISGTYSDTVAPTELAKKLTVDGDTLIIEVF